MKNRILSIIAGLAGGWLVVFAGEAIIHQIYPLPEIKNFDDKEFLSQLMNSLPNYYFILLLVNWVLSVVVAGMITSKLVKSNWQKATLIVSIIMLLGAVINMIMIPHPLWVKIVTIFIYLPFGYIGGRLVRS